MSWLPAGAVLVLLGALALVALAAGLARRQRWTAAALVIAAAALLVRAYAAADLALHPWDERYHALVAKSLLDDPLVPTLYADPVLPYDYRDWTRNHLWLHKPPLTLWVQAASMAVFGVAEIPLRAPSVLFSTLAVLVTFAIGRTLFSPAAGLVAAAFHASNAFLVDLAAGRRPSDHVDTLLILVVEAGLLAAMLAARRAPARAGVALGIACGAAWLTKSVAGLLLLPIGLLVRSQTGPRAAAIRETVIATPVALAIAAPWVIYCAGRFPQEWAHEAAYTWRHATETLEGHGGPAWSYLADMPRYFGEAIWIPLAAAAASAIRGTAPPARRALLAWIAVPYAVFSLMPTKMPSYIMLAAPALFLAQADFWLSLRARRRAERQPWRRALLAAALVVLALSPARALLAPTGPLEHREREPAWARHLRDLPRAIGPGKAVVFNVPAAIEAMFYTPYVAYRRRPSGEQVAQLHARGYRVYLYEPRENGRPYRVIRLDGPDAPPERAERSRAASGRGAAR